MAKKAKKRAPAFPEKAELLAYIKLATKLAQYGPVKSAPKIDPSVQKLIDAVKSEDLCGDGNDQAARIIERATGVKFDVLRPLIGDDENADAESYPSGACVMKDGKPWLSLGFDNCSDREFVDTEGSIESNEIKEGARLATEAELGLLKDAQLKRLLGRMRDRSL